jgi:hypothetical protein
VLQSLIGTVSDLVPDPPNVTAKTNPVVEELARVSGWAKDIAIKFVDDVLGVAGAVLDRYRKWELVVPKPGTPPLVLDTAEVVVRGVPQVRLASGIYVPQGGSADPNNLRIANESKGPGFQQPGRTLSPESFGRPPAWARYGSKGLFVVGSALTLYDVGASQWENDQKYHPEWSTGQRVANTGYSVATEGGGAVLGGMAGATWGASIGTAIFPGAGTIVGGIVGGAIGAFAGSKIGKAFGTGVKQGAKGLWNSMFG